MASAQEKEMGNNADLTNVARIEPDPGLMQSLDKDLDTHDVSDTQFSSISAPSYTVQNGSSSQEMASPEAQKLEHQKSKGMIALIMSALCVRSCNLMSLL